MKSQLVALLLSGVLVREARALNPANPTELAAIQKEIDQVKDIQTRKDGIDDIEGQILAEEGKRVGKSGTRIDMYKSALSDLKFRQGVIAHQILKDVERAYDIHPPHYSGQLAIDALQGEMAHWDPKVKDLGPDGSELRAVVDDKGRPMVDPSGKQMVELYLEAPNIHCDGNDHMDCKPIPMRYPVPAKATPGSVTWPNGLIEVDLKMFLESPGYIAASVYHETIHFKQLTDPNSQTRPKTDYDSEVDAFDKEEKAGTEYFGLTTQEYARIDQTKINELNWTKTHPSRFILVPTRPGSFAASPADLGTPEAIKAGGDADFLKGAAQLNEITANTLDEFNSFERQEVVLNQYQQQREQQRLAEEAHRAQEAELQREQQAAAAARQQAAQSCGMEEINKPWGDGAAYGFRDKKTGHTFYYHGTATLDGDAAKVAFMLARACLQQTDGYFSTYNGPVGEPCNDAMGTMQSRWRDGNFRYSLTLGTIEYWSGEPYAYQEAPHFCIDYVVSALRGPVDMQRVRDAMQEFRRKAIEWKQRDEAILASRGSSNGGQGNGNGAGQSPRSPGGSGGFDPPAGCRWLETGKLAGCPADSL